MEICITPQRFSTLIGKAFASGMALPTGMGLKWPASGHCSNPIQVMLVTQRPDVLVHPTAVNARNEQYLEEYDDGTFRIIGSERVEDIIEAPLPELQILNPMWLEVMTRCRKCDDCLRARRSSWTARSLCEFAATAGRTWFVTLTYDPHWRHQICLKSQAKYGNIDFANLAKVSSVMVTRYFKRVRKNTKKKFRYMMVHEPHQDGFPHVHMLLHEQSAHITKRELQREWPYGFSNPKLCSADKAHYICKYVSKDVEVRVRASIRYGRSSSIVRSTSGETSTLLNLKEGT